MIVDCVGLTVKTVQVTAWPGSRIIALSLIDNYLKAEGRSTWREEPWRESPVFLSICKCADQSIKGIEARRVPACNPPFSSAPARSSSAVER